MAPIRSFLLLSMNLAGIQSQTTTCNDTYPCKGYAIRDILIYFNGYRSGEDVNAIAEFQIGCHASHSCIQSRNLSTILMDVGSIGLYGPFGAFNSSFISSEWVSSFGAYASADCESLSASTELECSGYSSCRESKIYSTPLIHAYGAYSLSNSIIQATQDIVIEFYGYKSGYNATVHCGDINSCNIECSAFNACENMQCIGHGCKIAYTVNKLVNNRSVVEYDAFDLLTSVDDECNQNVGAVTCCRAYQSCYERNSPLAFDGTVNCAGGASCSRALLAGTNVVCSGEAACFSLSQSSASVISATNVYCIGRNGCTNAIIYLNDNGLLDCGGYRSCDGSIIETSGTGTNVTMQFSGYKSYSSSTSITCKETDVCQINILANRDAIFGSITCDGLCIIELSNIILSTQAPTPKDPIINPTQYPTFAPLTNITSNSVKESDKTADNTLELMTILSVGSVMFVCSMFAFYYAVTVRRRKLEEIAEIEKNQNLDDVATKRVVNSNDVQMSAPQITVADDSSEKKDDDDFVIETNDKSTVDTDHDEPSDHEKEESLYTKDNADVVVETNHVQKGTIDTQIAGEGDEGFDEYRRIGDILEAIVGDGYEDYLTNFKQQMITDKRLFDDKFQNVYNRDHDLWNHLIPAVGLRFEVFEKIFGDV